MSKTEDELIAEYDLRYVEEECKRPKRSLKDWEDEEEYERQVRDG